MLFLPGPGCGVSTPAKSEADLIGLKIISNLECAFVCRFELRLDTLCRGLRAHGSEMHNAWQ